MPAKLTVTLVKSPVSHTARTRATVRALGLHRIGQTVEVADTPEMRGMLRAVRFLLSVAEVAEASPAAAPARGKTSKQTEEVDQ
jgi:large subunit ribosomal protein L30